MHSPYLTKSDFKAARTCPTKLYYRHLNYPSGRESDEFMAALAEQGYLVEALARLRYPQGLWPTGNEPDRPFSVEAEAAVTAAALTASGDVILFEATFISQGKLARIDILVRQGNTLRLMEIKSKGLKSHQESDVKEAFWTTRAVPQLRPNWRPYLEDVTFQWVVLSECYPNATIIPMLIVLDISQTNPVDHLERQLKSGAEVFHSAAVPDPSPLILEIDVTHEVQALLPEVRESVANYLKGLLPSLQRLGPQISTHCRDCEYRSPKLMPNGFHECWGDLADVSPHILDLYSVGTVGGRNGRLVDDLIADGKVSLYDIPLDAITKTDGSIGAQAERQRRQIHQTQLAQEWFSPALSSLLNELPYPLYFIDFETATPTIPRYVGMRPFEIVAFQWSCHTIIRPGAPMIHADWLQQDDVLPNVAFVRSLQQRLGDEGTILVWSGHERNVLRSISSQLTADGRAPDGLARWIAQATAGHPEGRMLDLYRVATTHYYHPLMGGKATVKLVCEAVWSENEALRARYPEFSGPNGQVQSPYQSLPPLAIDEQATVVRNGTDAVLAYRHMMGDDGPISTTDQEQWRRLLRQYCRLDTLAMVMIWEHWQQTGSAD